MRTNLSTEEIAKIVHDSSKEAVVKYLGMCELDSPWEVPETFMASEVAKALHACQLRTAIEFKLDRAGNAPTDEQIRRTSNVPARLRKAYAHLDLVIFESTSDPWKLEINGIVEFKRHDFSEDDARLIEFMMDRQNVSHGLLVLLVVGNSEDDIKVKLERLIKERIESKRWEKLDETAATECCPPIRDSGVIDRY